MATKMVVSATAIYFGTARLLAAAAAFGLLALRESGKRQRMVALGAVAAAMAVAYVFVRME